jgi:hypothetical protein
MAVERIACSWFVISASGTLPVVVGIVEGVVEGETRGLVV